MTRLQFLQCLAALFLSGMFTAGCGGNGNEEDGKSEGNLPESREMVQFFTGENPGREIVKFASQDLNDDGREDLVVIYRVSRDKNMMRVVLNLDGGMVQTNEVPAPYSDQVITFRNIDRKPPVEFIVQGTRGAKTGYAVFRIEEGRLVDLFGDGMEGCC